MSFWASWDWNDKTYNSSKTDCVKLPFKVSIQTSSSNLTLKNLRAIFIIIFDYIMCYYRICVHSATLVWVSQLTVIIKGTEIHYAEHGSYVNLRILDVLQIIGRAGRPQIWQIWSPLHHHGSLQTFPFSAHQSVSIESRFLLTFWPAIWKCWGDFLYFVLLKYCYYIYIILLYS